MLGYTHTHPGSRHPPIADTPAPRANTPWEQTPPGADTPLGADTPQSKHPPREQTPPQEQTPPCHRACWEIWSMHGRYASYWNAVLLTAIFTARKQSLRRLCFYTCLSFCPGGGGISACLAGLQAHTWGVCIPTCTDATPPLQTATAVGSTHPTGMHSCLSYFRFIIHGLHW